MPKITRHGGPTYADAQEAVGEPATPVGTEPVNDPEYAAGPDAAEPDGGEGSSRGSSSSTSSGKPAKSPEQRPADSPKPASSTGSRSGKGRTGGSSARSTGGGRTGSEQN